MQIPDIIIAIDGFSATGKSTLAKLIAETFSFVYLDSGALYRGVTLFAQENGFIDPDDTIHEADLKAALDQGLDLHFGADGTYIGDRRIEQEIRTMAVSGQVMLSIRFTPWDIPVRAAPPALPTTRPELFFRVIWNRYINVAGLSSPSILRTYLPFS